MTCGNPGNANLPIGDATAANREIGVPGGADRSELNPPLWFITGVLATHRLDRSEGGAV